MSEETKILVIGPGAIGGVVAGLLARKGYAPTLVTKYPELAMKIREEGIRVLGEKGEFRVTLPAVASPQELEDRFDYILIATKAEDLEAAARASLHLMDENSRAVSMQNGICEEILASVAGEERTVGCVVGWGATMHEPGKVEMTSSGEFVLGNWKRESDEALEKLAAILSTVADTRTSGNILAELYSKLIINSCITTLGAICGLYLGEMLSRQKVRKIFIGIMREAMAVAKAMKLEVPAGAGGKLDYYKFLAPGPLSGLKRHLTIRIIGMKYRRLKSSSLQSLERGRKTEVDNYNGYIWEKGQSLDVATPINKQLTLMVREIENGKRSISPRNFDEIILQAPA